MKENLASDLKNNGAASVASVIFLLTLDVILRAVQSCVHLLVIGVMKGPLLKQLAEGHSYIQDWPLLLHGQASDLTHFTVGLCVHH